MSGLRFVALGVGDAFSARYYSSALAVEAAGEWLLLDCPHPIRKILHEASATCGTRLDLDRIAGVALTHLHADHSSGVEGLGFYGRFVLGRQMVLLAHPAVSEQLWQGQLTAAMASARLQPDEPPERRRFEDFFNLLPLSDTASVTFGPFTIRCRPTNHSIPTTAFRIEAGGRCLGYSADTPYDPGLIDWLAAADLIVHETSQGVVHTPYECLAPLPAALRSKMRLIHYGDTFDVTASAIEPLRQGASYAV